MADRSEGRLNWQEQDFLDAAITAERVGQRGRRRRIQIAFAALLAVAVLIAVIAVVAVGQGNEAARQRDVAKSRQLAAEASNALAVDPALGLTLALRAVEAAPTTQADEVLRQATAESHGRALIAAGGGPVYAVRFLPDGRHVVSGSGDGVVRLWDLADDALQRSFAVHTGKVYALRISPDGRAVVSASKDGTVAVTPLDGGPSRILLHAPVGVSNIELSRSGGLLAASLYDGTVHLIELSSGRERAVLGSGEPINAVAISADDAFVATAGFDGTTRIWSLRDGGKREIANAHNGAVFGVAFSGGRLVTAGNDGAVRLWDPGTGAPVRAFAVADRAVYTVRFSPDGQRFAVASVDGAVRLWDVSGFALATLRGHEGSALDVDFDSAGDTLVSGGTDGTVRSWAAERDEHTRGPNTAATFDRSATRIVSGTPTGGLRVWAVDGCARSWTCPTIPSAASRCSRPTDPGSSATARRAGSTSGRPPTVAC